MFQPVTLYIGLRYLRGRNVDRFGRLVNWLSALGIALGVAALVTVLSVMNGFQRELQNNILGLMPQALITTHSGHLHPADLPASHLKLRGVKMITPLTRDDVVLQSASNVAAGVMLGIDPYQPEPLSRYLTDSSLLSLQPGRYQVILGERLANQLRVTIGDTVRMMVPSVSHFTPIGRIPSERLFTVAGMFAANSEVDSYQMLVNIQDASRLLRYPPGEISGWRLTLDDPLNVAALSQQPLPVDSQWQDWRARKGELFQAVRMEKNLMGLLLSLIIAVAAFNIITSLGLTVMEKQAEVAILQTQGLARYQVILVFMVQGASAGIIGALSGSLLGVLLVSQIDHLLPIIGRLLDSPALPVQIEPLQVSIIVLLSVLIALLSTLYPAWRAAAVQPVEALRYE